MDLSLKATKLIKSGRDLEGTLSVNLDKLKDRMGEFFAPVIEPEESFDLSAQFVLHHRKMKHCRDRVAGADLDHQDEIKELSRLLRLRGATSQSLSGQLVSLRRACHGFVGDEKLDEWGLDGAVSQDAETIMRHPPSHVCVESVVTGSANTYEAAVAAGGEIGTRPWSFPATARSPSTSRAASTTASGRCERDGS